MTRRKPPEFSEKKASQRTVISMPNLPNTNQDTNYHFPAFSSFTDNEQRITDTS